MRHKSSNKFKAVIFSLLLVLLVWLASQLQGFEAHDDYILSYQMDPRVTPLQMYWKNDEGLPFKSIEHLKTFVEAQNKELVFAMNGGIYQVDYQPLGLFIEDHFTHVPLNTSAGEGNFYLQPNGVFFLTDDHQAGIVPTSVFEDDPHIQYATQSGPMLLVDGKINSRFNPDSESLFIRNGVGILPDGQLIFAMSKKEVNFYTFAHFFKQRGCKNALYLDGFVSRAYLPEENWRQTDGDFAVLLAVTAKK